MNIDNAYNAWASTYDSDRNLTRDLDATITRTVLSGKHYASILELGCGTGKNTVFYQQIGQRVCALDFSAGMIAQAHAKFAPDTLIFAIADLTQVLPCVSNSADLAVCNLVLEHIADLGALFAEAYRVLKPSGHFFVSELHPFRQYRGRRATFQDGDNAVEINAFIHHTSDFVREASACGFRLNTLQEWWHADDTPTDPRIISFLFEKP